MIYKNIDIDTGELTVNIQDVEMIDYVHEHKIISYSPMPDGNISSRGTGKVYTAILSKNMPEELRENIKNIITDYINKNTVDEI